MASVAELKKTVKGLVMPIPAVFDGKGEPDLPMMEKLTDWYLDSGVHGFFILGSQGQGPATTIEQRKVIAETVVKRVNKRVPCIVQIGAVEPYTSIELGITPNRSAPTASASSVPITTAIVTSGN
jgi:dihydrodipicolinate synthase/N-acetylneuraminate lyase